MTKKRAFVEMKFIDNEKKCILIYLKIQLGSLKDIVSSDDYNNIFQII